jgi:hypothetical protein
MLHVTYFLLVPKNEVQCFKAAQMRSETKEVVAFFTISESIKWKN